MIKGQKMQFNLYLLLMQGLILLCMAYVNSLRYGIHIVSANNLRYVNLHLLSMHLYLRDQLRFGQSRTCLQSIKTVIIKQN